MKNGENYNKNARRGFLKSIAGGLLTLHLLPLLQACGDKAVSLIFRLTGTNHILGHRLRGGSFPKPSETLSIPYLIIGGGITGLSAARQLTKKGVTDFIIVELEKHTGGNSSNGENKYSKFPLGAHYLPLPNFHDKELLDFLYEERIITGYNAGGFPEYDEEQLTFSPQERLFIKNTWQEGLVPKYGNSERADAEFGRFFKLMETFREAKGKDGRYFFDIPIALCSADLQYNYLDGATMKRWLDDNSFNEPEILEYTDYCCRDDFGLGIAYVSAWAGIHYFAARKHTAGVKYKDNVFTWPEGNARLATHLKKYTTGKIMANSLAYSVSFNEGKAVVNVYDDLKKQSIAITAGKVIMATPQFVNQYLLPDRKEFSKNFHYAPWILATLTLKDIPGTYSYPLCWENVIYKGKGLGYIYNQHQQVNQVQERKVITYYHSISVGDLKKARQEVYQKPADYWKAFIFDDLKAAHPDIEELTEEILIHRLGHGMISPVPGFMFSEGKRMAAQPIGRTVYFAHSDLSGISIFEEAFHQGINVVNQVLHDAALDS